MLPSFLNPETGPGRLLTVIAAILDKVKNFPVLHVVLHEACQYVFSIQGTKCKSLDIKTRTLGHWHVLSEAGWLWFSLTPHLFDPQSLMNPDS